MRICSVPSHIGLRFWRRILELLADTNWFSVFFPTQVRFLRRLGARFDLSIELIVKSSGPLRLRFYCVHAQPVNNTIQFHALQVVISTFLLCIHMGILQLLLTRIPKTAVYPSLPRAR